MHIEAYNGFARMLALSGWWDNPIVGAVGQRGLDVGGADVNGSVRGQLPDVTWTGVDIAPAPGVDIVADASTIGWLYAHPHRYDIVIATELFEHTEHWADIIYVMSQALRSDGPQILIATCASTGRPPHGARGEWGVPEGQYYGNVAPDDLRVELGKWFREVHVEYNPNPGDAYMFARGVKRDCICGSGDPDEDLQGRNPRCAAGGTFL